MSFWDNIQGLSANNLFKNGSNDNANIFDAVDNFFTGNLDFRRNKSLSDTQYQRAAADLQAAGLNPGMLLSGGGNPAPAVASHSSQGLGSLAGLLGNIVNSAMSLANTSLKNDKLEEITEKKLADARYLAEVNNNARLQRSINRDNILLKNASLRSATAYDLAKFNNDANNERLNRRFEYNNQALTRKLEHDSFKHSTSMAQRAGDLQAKLDSNERINRNKLNVELQKADMYIDRMGYLRKKYSK